MGRAGFRRHGVRRRARAASTCVESALFVALPHFLTVSRIHLTEKCSSIAPRPSRRPPGGCRAAVRPSPLVSQGLPGMTPLTISAAETLPADRAGALAGRVWRPDVDGPSVVAIRDGGAFDVSRAFPTMRDLCEAADPARALRRGRGRAGRPARPDPRQHAARAARPRRSPGCSRRSTSRPSRPPASPSRSRCSSASSRSGRAAIRTRPPRSAPR